MNEKKSLTVHYRKLSNQARPMNGLTLEQCIRNAMATVVDGSLVSERARLRAWPSPSDDSDIYLMNIYHADEICFFGDLTVYTSGFMQALLRNEPGAAMLNVSQQRPPQDHEYIHSIMYWMALNDHVLMIQSRALNSRHLEQYLTWLLRDSTNTMAGDPIVLDSSFDVDDVGGDLDDVKEIIVGGTGVLQTISDEQPPDREPNERENGQLIEVDRRRSWGERARNVLKAIMNNEADVQNLLENIPEGADLDVSVHIGYKTHRRKVSRAPMQRALRNLPDGDITTVGKYGRSKGQDIRLSFPVRVQMQGSLPDIIDIRMKLYSAYHYFVENGKIEP